MALTLRQWIVRSITIASAGVDDNTSTLLNAEDAAEALAHHCMYEVAEELASNVRTAPLVQDVVSLSLTNGVATLPSRVLVNHLSRATVTRSSDATLPRKVRYLPWRDFVRPLNSRYGSFSVRDGTQFNLVLPGSTYTPGSGLTGTVELTTAVAPDMPATDSATIDVPLKVEELLVARLAEKLLALRKEARAA